MNPEITITITLNSGTERQPVGVMRYGVDTEALAPPEPMTSTGETIFPIPSIPGFSEGEDRWLKEIPPPEAAITVPGGGELPPPPGVEDLEVPSTDPGRPD